MQFLPEPHLPNFFLSPQRLEQSLRALRARALARPPPQIPPATLREQESNRRIAGGCRGHQITQTSADIGTGTGGARRVGIPRYRWRTPSETHRISDIFSSRGANL